MSVYFGIILEVVKNMNKEKEVKYVRTPLKKEETDQNLIKELSKDLLNELKSVVSGDVE